MFLLFATEKQQMKCFASEPWQGKVLTPPTPGTISDSPLQPLTCCATEPRGALGGLDHIWFESQCVRCDLRKQCSLSHFLRRVIKQVQQRSFSAPSLLWKRRSAQTALLLPLRPSSQERVRSAGLEGVKRKETSSLGDACRGLPSQVSVSSPEGGHKVRVPGGGGDSRG